MTDSTRPQYPDYGSSSASGSPTTGTPPARIGRYRILSELGRGGMGIVYEAEDPRLMRRIALKVLPDHLTRDGDALHRLEREAQLLAALNHPNVATIYSLEETDDHHFLTLELIPGDLMAGWMRPGPVAMAEALPVLRQIANALEAAHAAGVVHRDLKPQNIIITPDERVKVLDFGLAKSVQVDMNLTSPGFAVGTPGYMSPELLRGQAVDARADIFAFGCILYECLTGRRSFAGDTPTDVMVSTLQNDPDWTVLPSDVPARLRDLTARCLAKNPDERLGRADALRREIEETMAERALPSSMRRPAPVEERPVPHNLPVRLASFVGRHEQLEAVGGLLDEHRLVTLSGAGGAGKTRLALETLHRSLDRFPDGVWLTELAPVADPERVPDAVTKTLGLEQNTPRTPVEALTDALSGKRVALLFDNCEHVLAATSELAGDLLEMLPDLRILATSREGLGITGERIVPVPPLSVPGGNGRSRPDDLRGSEAVELFVERAVAADPAFTLTAENAPSVAHICRRLDGIPLALELAAARVRIIPVEEIARRLDDRFRLLTGGSRTALPHHQTLRSLIDWGYELLTDSERAVLRRLAVFAGGWSLESAEAVGAGGDIEGWEVLDLISHLVDKSMLERDVEKSRRSGRARFRMLETVRDYARERLLESGEAEETRARHRDHFLGLAIEAGPHLLGPDQEAWFGRLTEDDDNVHLAFEEAIASAADLVVTEGEPVPETDNPAVTAMQAAAAIGRYFVVRGLWNEGRRMLDNLVDLPAARVPTEGRARTLNWAGNSAMIMGDFQLGRARLAESLGISQSLGLRAAEAATIGDMGYQAYVAGDLAEARSCAERAVAIRRELGEPGPLATALLPLAWALASDDKLDDAMDALGEAEGIKRRIGDHHSLAMVLNLTAHVERRRRNNVQARARLDEALSILTRLKDRWGMARAQDLLGRLELDEGHRHEARELFRQALRVRIEYKNSWAVAASFLSLAGLAQSEGESETAGCLLGAANRQLETYGGDVFTFEREEALATRATIEADLGVEAFEAAWVRGRALSTEEAGALAMEV